MSYTSIKNDIYGVLATANISAQFFPATYTDDIDTSNTFVKVSILSGNTKLIAHSVTKSTKGLVIFSIYSRSDKELVRVADALDTLFQLKTLPNGTQMGLSHLNGTTQDSLDLTLFREDYRIEFNFTENI